MIYAGAVFYNKKIRDSKLVESLLKQGFEVVIFDNSDSPAVCDDNRKFCEEFGFNIIGDGKNHGVSFAYNAVVSKVTVSLEAGDMLAFFDDDSVITDSYFDAVKRVAGRISTGESAPGIYLPIVMIEDGRIVSPSKITALRDFKMFRSKEEALSYKGRDISGINTGMLVSLSVYDSISYDRRLFIDNIDHAFIESAKKCGIEIRAFDGEIKHSLTEFGRPDKESTMKRFKHFLADSRIYYPWFARGYHIVRRTLKYTFMYRDPGFIKQAFLRTKEE